MSGTFSPQIAEELFVKGESSGEIGTTVASMNRTGKFTAKTGPYDEYNAFKEFFDRETEAHIIAAWLSFAGIQKMSGDQCRCWIKMIPVLYGFNLKVYISNHKFQTSNTYYIE